MKTLFTFLGLLVVVSFFVFIARVNDCPIYKGKHKFKLFKVTYTKECKSFEVTSQCIYCGLDKDKTYKHIDFVKFLNIKTKRNWQVVAICNKIKQYGEDGLLIKDLRK